ncbi:MAG: hypothetical protein LBP51_06130 [Deferribacteraceae bacterium]|jgi:uncharacterized membrane protein|nr:hypothetical protein [Deferribacteraceae bacterium]
MRRVLNDFRDHILSWREYWQAYGGLGSIVGSIYFWIAVLGTIVLPKPIYIFQDISIISSLLGFSIAGFALYLNSTICKYDTDSRLASIFTHFIIIQGLALFVNYVCKTLGQYFFLCQFLFLYALLLIFPLVFGFFHLSRAEREINKSERRQET